MVKDKRLDPRTVSMQSLSKIAAEASVKAHAEAISVGIVPAGIIRKN